MTYDLQVADEKVKPHQITTLHLVSALAFIVAGAIIFRYNYDITYQGLALMVAGILLALITIVKNQLVTGRSSNIVFRFIELAISLAIAVYSVIHGWRFPIGIFSMLSAAIIFAVYWERSAGTPLYIHIEDDGVRLPVTSRKRFIPWTEIEQVVLRYGILSVDCTNNQLHQWTIPVANVAVSELEKFCSDKVEEYRPKRRNDDW